MNIFESNERWIAIKKELDRLRVKRKAYLVCMSSEYSDRDEFNILNEEFVNTEYEIRNKEKRLKTIEEDIMKEFYDTLLSI